jgi:acyl carrier protein
MDNKTISRICNIIASVLGVPASQVLATTSQQTIEGWDSLAHVHLVTALEAEFGVSFSIDQALEITSVPSIYAALVEHDAVSTT